MPSISSIRAYFVRPSSLLPVSSRPLCIAISSSIQRALQELDDAKRLEKREITLEPFGCGGEEVRLDLGVASRSSRSHSLSLPLSLALLTRDDALACYARTAHLDTRFSPLLQADEQYVPLLPLRSPHTLADLVHLLQHFRRPVLAVLHRVSRPRPARIPPLTCASSQSLNGLRFTKLPKRLAESRRLRRPS